MTIGNNLNLLSLNLQKNLAKLSLSQKLDDKSNQSLYREMESDISSKGAEVKNLNNGIGFMQIADGALSSLSKQTTKLQELSVKKGDGTLNSQQKQMIESQMADIKKSMNQTINESSYNGINVFHSGAFSENGINLSLNANDIDTNDIDSINNFQKSIANHQSSVGAFINSSKENIENLSTSIVNESEAKSNLEVDFAKEAIDFANNKTKFSASQIANAHNTDKLKNSVNALLA